MEIRELHGAADMQQCEAVQREVWGMGDLEIVPSNQLIASLHAGGCLLGAWQGDKLVGFVYGFPAYHPKQKPPQGMHSHMMAVLPEARGLGLGKQLKWAQRDWCLTRGLTWITWTFDPLQTRNARLNFEHFGTWADHYLDDVYGELTNTLNSGLPTDRLLAMWHLHDAQVDALGRGEVQPDIHFDVNESPFALENNDGEPKAANLSLHTPSVRVAVPADVSALKRYAPEVALKWRLEQRRVLHHYFANGYRIRRFVSGVYLLTKEATSTL